MLLGMLRKAAAKFWWHPAAMPGQAGSPSIAHLERSKKHDWLGRVQDQLGLLLIAQEGAEVGVWHRGIPELLDALGQGLNGARLSRGVLLQSPPEVLPQICCVHIMDCVLGSEEVHWLIADC